MAISQERIIEEFLPIQSIRPAAISARYACHSDETSIKELALSIRRIGLIQPVTVRSADNGFEIVAGHRRFYACKLLRWKSIPAKVLELSDKDAFEIQLVENMQRKSMDPIEEAEAFKKYIVDYGWGGVSQLAHVILKSEQYVSSRIQLLKLSKEVLEEIIQDKLKVSHAMEMVNMSENDQHLMTSAIINENLSVHELRKIARYSKKNSSEDTDDFLDHHQNPSLKITKRQIFLLKKTRLSLRISLARIDSLIHETNQKLKTQGSPILETQMSFRLAINAMIGETSQLVNELKKKF
jgi:ParB family chromosome partitioning protein